jgi:hypothetical protein
VLTSYFGAVRQMPSHLVPVAISRGVPRGWSGLRYPLLAPTWEMLKLPPDEYLRRFDLILKGLDPAQVVVELERLAGNAGVGSEPEDQDLFAGFDEAGVGVRAFVPVMLCWEAPGQYCHRRTVAEWLEDRTGLVVAEWRFEQVKYPRARELPWKGGVLPTPGKPPEKPPEAQGSDIDSDQGPPPEPDPGGPGLGDEIIF